MVNRGQPFLFAARIAPFHRVEPVERMHGMPGAFAHAGLVELVAMADCPFVDFPPETDCHGHTPDPESRDEELMQRRFGRVPFLESIPHPEGPGGDEREFEQLSCHLIALILLKCSCVSPFCPAINTLLRNCQVAR